MAHLYQKSPTARRSDHALHRHLHDLHPDLGRADLCSHSQPDLRRPGHRHRPARLLYVGEEEQGCCRQVISSCVPNRFLVQFP